MGEGLTSSQAAVSDRTSSPSRSVCLTLCDPIWTVTHWAPLCLGFSKQDYWSGLSIPSPGDLPDPRIKSTVPALVKVKVKPLSRVQLLATPWTVTHQAPPSMGFSRQEYWSGLPFPSPGDLPDPLSNHSIDT